ncbi:hypothetical protein [Piscirickettsia salmonis]|uniref:hypothetical protein n=1 Tax=Piscirickettsia salmonis TaxID=1238 RepID=UPI0007D85F1B|nr:hypothetical protein A0O36_01479 [Piscirickettsiaceae bacterium NZ-RLO1]
MTLNACYQGAYSNAIMFLDRILAGDGITNYLLSAKRELIQQHALHYLSEAKKRRRDIHIVNSLYNCVAPSYHMRLIPDTYGPSIGPITSNAFSNYLDKHITASVLIDAVEKIFVIPSEYNYQQMEHILPKSLFKHWSYALYNTEGQAPDIAQTGRLLLIVILQELGFIEGAIKEITVDSDNSEERKKIYQTDTGIFIEEWVEDQITYEPRPMVRVLNNSEEDSNLIFRHYDELKDKLSPSTRSTLPLSVLLKLIHIPNATGWAFALANNHESKDKLIAALCLVVDQGQTGLRVLGLHSPESVKAALALATTEEDKSKLVAALCQIDNKGWTGLKYLMHRSPELIPIALALAITQEDKSKILAVLHQIDNEGRTELDDLIRHSPELVPSVLTLAITQEDKSKILAALCQVNRNGLTILKDLIHRSPQLTPTILSLAITQEDKSKVLAILCQIDSKTLSGLSSLIVHSSEYFNTMLAFATTEEDKSKILTALCYINSQGWVVLRSLMIFSPYSIDAVLALATTEENKSKILAALCQVDHSGRTGLRDAIRRYPALTSTLLALATTAENKSKTLAALCQVDNNGGTGLRDLIDRSPECISTILSLAITQENKSKIIAALCQDSESTIIAALCQVGSNGWTGLKTLGHYYPPQSISAVLALATTQEDKSMLLATLCEDDKSKFIAALCQIGSNGKIELNTLLCHTPELSSFILALATTEENKSMLLATLCQADNQNLTGILEALERSATKSAPSVFALATSDLCKSILVLSQAKVTLNDYSSVRMNPNLQKALVAAYGYLNSGRFGWNRTHGNHGKEQTYQFIQNLMARENKNLNEIQAEVKQWLKGYGFFSFSSNCNRSSRVRFAYQSELFGQAATPFFEMRDEERKATRQAILNFSVSAPAPPH